MCRGWGRRYRLSSVAATRLGTSVPVVVRGTASGIINTAAQLGTALGIAALLLVAALTTGIPGPGSPVPAIAWGIAALIACTGAIIFGLKSASHPATADPMARALWQDTEDDRADEHGHGEPANERCCCSRCYPGARSAAGRDDKMPVGQGKYGCAARDWNPEPAD